MEHENDDLDCKICRRPLLQVEYPKQLERVYILKNLISQERCEYCSLKYAVPFPSGKLVNALLSATNSTGLYYSI